MQVAFVIKLNLDAADVNALDDVAADLEDIIAPNYVVDEVSPWARENAPQEMQPLSVFNPPNNDVPNLLP